MAAAFDLDALYRRYGPMVFRRCRQLLRNDDAAHDALQDVFVQCARYQRQLNGDAPSSLLNRIATNVCLNRLRGGKTRQSESLDDALHVIADAEDPESRSLARRILSRLFESEQVSTRTMAVLLYVDGMTLEEVAAEVGLSVSGVRKRLRTLQARLPQASEVV